MIKGIGIDFGTTNSAVAIARADSMISLASFGPETTFRSVLYFAEDADARRDKINVAAGPDAIESYLNSKSSGRLIQSMKSYLTSKLFSQTQICGENYTLEELIGILLRHLRKATEAQFGELGSNLVVGRPVRFSSARDDDDDEYALTRLRTSFAHAGFTDVHFLPEPVAAAYKYQQQLTHEELVLIADFGGGTSDFSLVELKTNRHGNDMTNQVIGNDGVGIAGDTFDSKLVRNLVAPMLGLGSNYKTEFGKILPMPNWLYEHLERWHYLSFLKTRKNMALLKQLQFQALEKSKLDAFIDLVNHDLGYRLYRAVESAKCALSDAYATKLKFSEFMLEIVQPVTRAEFGTWIDPEINQISSCIERLLTTCNVTPKQIDAVFMTGGSSFVPAVRKIFEAKFPRAKIRSGHEFTSVAEGLALHALKLKN